MKVKEKCQQYKELFFEIDLSYQEWLRDNYYELSSKEIDQMEQEYLQGKHRASNNSNYRAKISKGVLDGN